MSFEGTSFEANRGTEDASIISKGIQLQWSSVQFHRLYRDGPLYMLPKQFLSAWRAVPGPFGIFSCPWRRTRALRGKCGNVADTDEEEVVGAHKNSFRRSGIRDVGAARDHRADGNSNPPIGKWKLKSTAPTPDSNLMTHESFGKHGMKIIIDAVDKDGVKSRWYYTTNFDGKDEPITGNSAADSGAVRIITRVASKTGSG